MNKASIITLAVAAVLLAACSLRADPPAGRVGDPFLVVPPAHLLAPPGR